MFVRATKRKKEGKVHRYWSIVENRRLPGGRVSQRHVRYLGEINSSQEQAWRKSIEVFDEDTDQTRSLSLFPEARIDEAVVDESVVRLCLSQLRPHAPGLTPRSVLKKFAAVQMVDVEIPTADGRLIQLTRYTEPTKELKLLLERLKLDLPAQPPL